MPLFFLALALFAASALFLRIQEGYPALILAIAALICLVVLARRGGKAWKRWWDKAEHQTSNT